jgi:hypothetical protein
VVDIYNSTSNKWTTASLTLARYALAATTIGDLAIFAGGTTGSVNYNDKLSYCDAV